MAGWGVVGMLVIPAVDVLAGRVVRLRRGDFAAPTRYDGDPVEVAQEWCRRGARLVHVVDLEGARSGTPDEGLWERLGEAGIPYQIGGGIRRRELAVRALATGAERVVLGTAAVWEPVWLKAAVAELGADRVVAAVDVRSGKAAGAGWTEPGRPLEAVMADLEVAGVGRILATGIERDGTLAGPDLELIRYIARMAPAMAVVASGGVATAGDVAVLAAAGAEGVVIGRALYEGRLTLAEAQRAAESGPAVSPTPR